jgi:hypothetical protein
LVMGIARVRILDRNTQVSKARPGPPTLSLDVAAFLFDRLLQH